MNSCRAPPRSASKYGTLFIADEIQTGIGRTGKFLAVEHWNVEPDMVLLAKALSGGHVPVGALLTRKSIFDKIFNHMDRAVVHGSTFAKNDLAMAAGIATLEVIKAEKLVEQAAKRGAELRLALTRDGARLRIAEGSARQGTDDRRRVRPAEIAAAEGVVERARDRQQGPVLPAHHRAAVQGSQDPDPGLRPRQPHHQAAAAARRSPKKIATGSKRRSTTSSPPATRSPARSGRSARRWSTTRCASRRRPSLRAQRSNLVGKRRWYASLTSRNDSSSLALKFAAGIMPSLRGYPPRLAAQRLHAGKTIRHRPDSDSPVLPRSCLKEKYFAPSLVTAARFLHAVRAARIV